MSAWEAKFRELRVRFAERTTEWVAEIDAAVEALRRDPGNLEAFGQIATYFHRIAGSAGTYELPHVSTLADEGEAICASLGGRMPTERELGAWLKLAGEIGREVSAARAKE